jgi:transcriptional regulator with XRE-family HTH domain
VQEKKFPAVAALMTEAIEDSGISQRDLAERMDLSETTVSNWVRGIRPPALENINAVCAILEISADTLLRAIGIELHPPAAAKLPAAFLKDLLALDSKDRRALSRAARGLLNDPDDQGTRT